MFKYSLFICKCSERESHFDCHIDCHFDCNLQLIVNFLSDNMSELKGVRSGAERMKKYRAENKQKCDLTNLKQNFRRSQLLGSGTPEGEKMRKAAAERKRLQRSREKEIKALEMDLEMEMQNEGRSPPGLSSSSFVTSSFSSSSSSFSSTVYRDQCFG